MVRVRFAPSPTGFLHIGGLRTCLFNYLFAKKNKGKFILRIEDTDRERYVEGATENLIRTLHRVGLKYDEGPVLIELSKISNSVQIKDKGKYGPYIQSRRLHIYQNLAQKLIDEGYAYYCFCTPEELEKMRQEQIAKKIAPHYDERCRKLSQAEINQKLRSGCPYVIRLKVPEVGTIKFKDLIRGEIEFDLSKIDDQVLVKSDGWPTYHLANVIDDHLMNITHVIRGEEWLPSMPKHLLIYQAFGWQPPQFAHLPLLLNPDRSKLSKRQGDIAVEEYLAKGYLPEALLNFIALLGWSPDTNQEIFTLKELIKQFSIEKIQKAGAIFNREKLDWINGYYIRKMNINNLTQLCIPYLVQAGLIEPLKNQKSTRSSDRVPRSNDRIKYQIIKTKEIVEFKWLKKIVALEQERLKRLDEIREKTQYFFADQIEYNPTILIWRKMTNETVKDNLNLVKQELEKLPKNKFTTKNIQNKLNLLAKNYGTGEIFWPFRVALTGLEASPPPAEIAEILGKEKTLKRIENAINKINKLKIS
jgi:glutamyl-tRNA synthetase